MLCYYLYRHYLQPSNWRRMPFNSTFTKAKKKHIQKGPMKDHLQTQTLGIQPIRCWDDFIINRTKNCCWWLVKPRKKKTEKQENSKIYCRIGVTQTRFHAHVVEKRKWILLDDNSCHRLKRWWVKNQGCIEQEMECIACFSLRHYCHPITILWRDSTTCQSTIVTIYSSKHSLFVIVLTDIAKTVQYYKASLAQSVINCEVSLSWPKYR